MADILLESLPVHMVDGWLKTSRTQKISPSGIQRHHVLKSIVRLRKPVPFRFMLPSK